jgi:hypothetical protein
MPRLMSVALTEAAVLGRSKTVTRRLGWQFLKPGDRLTLCRKVMGRKPDEPLVKIVDVQVVSTRWEPLFEISDDDVAREGFPNLDREGFIRFFCQEMGVYPEELVNRIEWVYLEADREDAS